MVDVETMEIECGLCGGTITVPPAVGSGPQEVECDRCGAYFSLRRPCDIGAETLFQPGLLADELVADAVAGGDPSTQRIRSQPGTVLMRDGGATPAAEPPAPSIRQLAHLKILGGDSRKRRVPIRAPKTVVGREHAHVNVDDTTLSAPHFEVEVRGGEYFVRDLDSTNGTFLNRMLIRSAQLVSGDVIHAGRTDFLFLLLAVIPWERGSQPVG